MRRREVIGLIGGAASWPFVARAQQPSGRVWRIGFLGASPPLPAMVNALRDGMRESGFVEGQNLSIDVRWLLDQNPNVAAELVSSGIDLIVAWNTPAVLAARRATATIPIVMVSIADPVGSGLVAELARPGGNITGTSQMGTELGGKHVQLLMEIVPGMKRVGVVRNSKNPASDLILRETEVAVRALGLQADIADAGAADEYESAFLHLSALGVGGVVLLSEGKLIEHRVRIAELAQKARLPTVFQRRENVDAGGLLSYGPNLNDLARQSALIAGRILKGARPAELPVEQPTQFTLVINLKTAKAIGLIIPPTLIARADEMIE
jgi:putative ABC transport system substrate-binding protein